MSKKDVGAGQVPQTKSKERTGYVFFGWMGYVFSLVQERTAAFHTENRDREVPRRYQQKGPFNDQEKTG